MYITLENVNVKLICHVHKHTGTLKLTRYIKKPSSSPITLYKETTCKYTGSVPQAI